MNIAAIFSGLLIITVFFCQICFGSEVKWGTMDFDNNIWSVWGRTYTFDNDTIFPEISSQGQLVTVGRPYFQLKQSNGRGEVIDKLASTFKPAITDSEIAHSQYLRTSRYDLKVTKTLQYDGFLRFDVSLSPKNLELLTDFNLKIPLEGTNTKYFSHFLPYDFVRQRIQANNFKKSTGFIDKDLSFEFTPTFWVGGNSVGFEWITETNEQWNLDRPDDALSLKRSGGITYLTVNFIKRKSGVTLNKALELSFAFFVNPSRPKMNFEKLYMVSGNREEPDGCTGTGISFQNWNNLPIDYPGLPTPTERKASDYVQIVNRTKAKGYKFVPYASLYLLPATHPKVHINRSSWTVGPARKNLNWTKKLKTDRPILSANMAEKSLQNFLLKEHISYVEKFTPDGMYFDGAMPDVSSHDTSPLLQSTSLKKFVFFPMFAHRKLLKTYWESMKSKNPNFIIIHHAPKVPKFATAFIDIVVVGEELNRMFRANTPLEKKITDNSKEVYSLVSPEQYTPDYDVVPHNHHNHLFNEKDAVTYMLLPQVIKFNNHKYLSQHPELYDRWSISALRYAEKHRLSIWIARLKKNSVRKYLDRTSATIC